MEGYILLSALASEWNYSTPENVDSYLVIRAFREGNSIVLNSILTETPLRAQQSARWSLPPCGGQAHTLSNSYPLPLISCLTLYSHVFSLILKVPFVGVSHYPRLLKETEVQRS